jgi:proline iminopeptidase
MSDELLTVNGCRVFVDVRGSDSAPTLLFIHGGPGLGCYDFMHYQGDRLSRDLRVVGVDQRGVLRSDDLPTDGGPTVEQLVADFEEIRAQLGITRWTVLGHSAGGAYALDYATAHPASVQAAIFDCPCWDCDLTDRNRLPVIAERLTKMGNTTEASRCLALAQKPTRITGEDQTWTLLQALGDSALELFFHDRAGAAEYDKTLGDSGLSQEQWQRGSSHLPLLTDMYRPRVDKLTSLEQPALLVHGRDDLVVPRVVIEAFSAGVPEASVHTFEHAGHFAYLEEPDEYSRVVTEFVAAHAQPRDRS